MVDLGIALAICVVMVLLTTLLYYEILRIIWTRLPHMKIRPRLRILVVIAAIFLGHTVSVWLYAGLYWTITDWPALQALLPGSMLQGHYYTHSFESALYFSAATYSTLGFGDVVPAGVLRIVTGVEALNGLVLIGWSVSFTYLAMVKFWDLHGNGKRK